MLLPPSPTIFTISTLLPSEVIMRQIKTIIDKTPEGFEDQVKAAFQEDQLRAFSRSLHHDE